MSIQPSIQPSPLHRAAGPLPPVRYEFRVQGGRGDAARGLWRVRSFRMIEAISEPYRITLEVVLDAALVDLDELLGDACEIALDRRASPRRIYGVILAGEELGRAGGRHHLRLEIGPALALLDQRVDTRAWQERSAPEVLHEVLAAPLAELGRKVKMDGLDRARYPIRDYCVQYRESDLDFASRLMEEEGISYYFTHEGGAEVLVLVDGNHGFAALLGDGEVVPLIEGAHDTAPAESLQRLHAGRRLTPTAVAQRSFDWQRPSEAPAAIRPAADRRGRQREVYAHDDVAYPGDEARHAAIAQERLRVREQVAAGEGNVTAFRAGGHFALGGHGAGDARYLVTKVTHRGECPDEAILAALAGDAPAPRYANAFECVPLTAAFRPPRAHKRPRVMGVQTATVTGPPGEEVHCDEHGRIKILPHWDRLSAADETSSWWVRVAQPVAGAGWGVLALPRVGMEVVVDFIDGDPDRPLVVGCVYNGDNPPPYALPGDKTKTTIRTSSSPGGGGYNELRFEDQAGAEEVFLHAQRDYNAVVNASRTLSVGAGDTTTVGANRTAVIGANDSTAVGASKSVTVAANYAESCGANHAVSVGAAESISVGAAQSVSVGAAQSVSVGGAQSVSVGADQSITVGGSQTTTVAGSQTNTITGDQIDVVTGDQTATITGNQSATITGNQSATVTGTHALTVTGAVTQTFSAGAALGITGAYTLTISGELSVDAGGKASLKAAQIEISGGDSKVTVAPGVVTVEGGCLVDIRTSGDVTVSGGAAVTITGGSVAVSGGTIALNC